MANFDRPHFLLGLTVGLLGALLIAAVAATAWLIPQASDEATQRLLRANVIGAWTATGVPIEHPAASTPARAVVGSSLEGAGESH